MSDLTPGEIVIHNDVIGVVISVGETGCQVKNVEGRVFNFNKKNCTSVIKPAALAKLYKEKLIARVQQN